MYIQIYHIIIFTHEVVCYYYFLRKNFMRCEDIYVIYYCSFFFPF